MKQLSALLLTLMLITGCNETLSQAEPPPNSIPKTSRVELSDGEEWLAADGTVVYNDENIIVDEPMDEFIFRNATDWRNEVRQNGGDVLKSMRSHYDEDFFTHNVLVCLPEVTSAGMNYQFEGITIDRTCDPPVLTVYTSYNSKSMMNHLAEYTFFIKLNRGDVPLDCEVHFGESYERTFT